MHLKRQADKNELWGSISGPGLDWNLVWPELYQMKVKQVTDSEVVQ